jgi:hypothetical protein
MVDSGQPFTLATWPVKKGREQEFVAGWSEFARWTNENASRAMHAQLIQSHDDESLFISLGPWKDFDSVARWRKMPEFGVFFLRAKEMCEDIKPQNMKLVVST